MTQHYVGTKIIVAWSQEKNDHPGYAVKYPDGYISWSPEDVFEKAYLPIGTLDGKPEWFQRLVAERAELAHRLEKLTVYLDASLDVPQGQLLRKQACLMAQYLEVLEARLAELNCAQ